MNVLIRPATIATLTLRVLMLMAALHASATPGLLEMATAAPVSMDKHRIFLSVIQHFCFRKKLFMCREEQYFVQVPLQKCGKSSITFAII